MSSGIATAARKRLLICNAGIPNPSYGASVVLFYQYIERLSREDFEILNILLVGPAVDTAEEVAQYRAVMEQRDGFRVMACHADHFVDSRRFLHTLNPRAATEVDVYLRGFEPDAILCFDLTSAWMLLGHSHRPTLTWLGDLNFQSYWYNALYGARENLRQAIWLPVSAIHAWHWKRIYRRVLRQSRRVVVSSKSSEAALGALGVSSHYLPYPWPSAAPLGEHPTSAPSIPTFLFLGSLTGLGSRSAFRYMAERLYPTLRHQWGPGKFQILVTGMRDLPAWVRTWLDGKPEFTYLGFVEDMDALMASTHAVIAPIDVPVGNRSRIVTAMAKGALVVAHRNTALGNPDLEDGVTCYLADTPEEFATRMRWAVERPEERKGIVQRARQRYEVTFAPDVATQRLVNEIKAILR